LRRAGLWNAFFLRPHGRRNLSPVAAIWIGFAWVVVIIMATLEGMIWAAVSRYLVPEGLALLALPVSVLMFCVIFAVIYTVDASLIMFQRPLRPSARYRIPRVVASRTRDGSAAGTAADTQGPEGRSSASGDDSGGSVDTRPVIETVLLPRGDHRFWPGLLLRLFIIAASIVITAPFLTQIIREDDIQRELERAQEAVRGGILADKTREIQRQIDDDRGLLEPLDTSVSRLIAERRERTESIDRQIETLQADYEYWAREAELELTGADGRRPGDGPKWRTAADNRDSLKAQLDQRLAERAAAVAALQDQIDETQAKIGEIQADIEAKRQRLSRIQTHAATMALDAFATEYGRSLPGNTLGARVKLLREIKEREAIPHLGSVEGLAQALLVILFLALAVIKLFEPKSMQFYYNEELQDAYDAYRSGAFDAIPGFDAEGQRRGLDYVRFAERYAVHAADPGFFHDHYHNSLMAEYLIREQGLLNEMQKQHETGRAELQLRAERARRRQELLDARRMAALERDKQRRLGDLEIERERQSLDAIKASHTQEIETQRAEIDNERRRLDAELASLAQAERQREQRLQQELDLERERLQAIADDLAARRTHAESEARNAEQQAAFELERQRLEDRRSAIDDEVQRLESARAAVRRDLARVEDQLGQLRGQVRQIEHDIARAQRQPEDVAAALKAEDAEITRTVRDLYDPKASWTAEQKQALQLAIEQRRQRKAELEDKRRDMAERRTRERELQQALQRHRRDIQTAEQSRGQLSERHAALEAQISEAAELRRRLLLGLDRPQEPEPASRAGGVGPIIIDQMQT
jgi:predicted  nucleic acid-binding Zn-ribbon protein